MTKVGRFQLQTVLEVHSLQAEQLIRGGRTKADKQGGAHSILGLKAFNALLSVVYQGVKADDPYADMVLIEVERRMLKASAKLTKLHTLMDSLLKKQLPGISTKLCESQQPVLIPLTFPIPHANMGARLVGEFDFFIRKMETCKRLGLLNSRLYHQYLREVRRLVRGVFIAPIIYKRSNVVRDDIINNSEKGEAAVQVLGEVPADILNKERRADFGPY